MRRKSEFYILALFLLIGLSGCWKEDLKNCWMGDVTLRVMAECFQEPPGGKTEENLGLRLKSVRYVLHKGEELYKQGVIDDATTLNTQQLTLTFPKLPFGDYTLSLYGNADEHGDITYPGAADTQDYFVSGYQFTVDCDCGFEDMVVMYRSQGVTHFKLENLPDNIAEIEVGISRLGLVCRPDTTYLGETEVLHRVKVSDVTTKSVSSLLIGSFPTIQEANSEMVIRLFAQGEPNFLVYEQKVAEAVITRNRLVRLEADFNHTIDADVAFKVTVNPKWDGVDGGGDIPIE